MRGSRGVLLALAAALAAVALLAGQGGASASSPQLLILDPVGQFSLPTYVTAPPGDTHRLFVVQQAGQIRLLIDRVLQPTPFLDASSWISCCGERGLLSMAFAPDYATSRRFYVYFTRTNTY